MNFSDRYSKAVRSSNLRSGSDAQHDDPTLSITDTDTLGAAGIAAKRHPLALALLRLFMGDNTSAAEIIEIQIGMARDKARKLGIKLTRVEAGAMADITLGYLRNSRCMPCGGHGRERIPGAPTLSDKPCGECRGTGLIIFDRLFALERLELARWMLAEMEREMAKAGPAAMAALAPRFEL